MKFYFTKIHLKQCFQYFIKRGKKLERKKRLQTKCPSGLGLQLYFCSKLKRQRVEEYVYQCDK